LGFGLEQQPRPCRGLSDHGACGRGHDGRDLVRVRVRVRVRVG
jgi:hypothetical protein